jgi:hypothetical protein
MLRSLLLVCEKLHVVLPGLLPCMFRLWRCCWCAAVATCASPCGCRAGWPVATLNLSLVLTMAAFSSTGGLGEFSSSPCLIYVLHDSMATRLDLGLSGVVVWIVNSAIFWVVNPAISYGLNAHCRQSYLELATWMLFFTMWQTLLVAPLSCIYSKVLCKNCS